MDAVAGWALARMANCREPDGEVAIGGGASGDCKRKAAKLKEETSPVSTSSGAVLFDLALALALALPLAASEAGAVCVSSSFSSSADDQGKSALARTDKRESNACVYHCMYRNGATSSQETTATRCPLIHGLQLDRDAIFPELHCHFRLHGSLRSREPHVGAVILAVRIPRLQTLDN